MSKPEMTYDDEADATYIRFSDEAVYETKTVFTQYGRKIYHDRNVNIDLDEYGYLVGIEVV